MSQQNIVSAAILVLIAAVLIQFPQILGDQTSAAVGIIGAYLIGLFRPAPQLPPAAPPTPPHVG